jgi:hypothetical protein
MKLLRRYQYILFFVGVLALCSYEVLRQMADNDEKHADKRDTFIRLCAKGRVDEAQALYVDLIGALEKESTQCLLADKRRASIFAADATPSRDDLVWRYYCSVTKELEKRQKQHLALNNT